MEWISKFFGVSIPRLSEGQYHGGYGEDAFWNYGPTPSVDHWSDYGNEDIDRAIALSLSQEDPKGKKVIDNDFQLEEDERLARVLQESLNIESSLSHDHGTTFRPQPQSEPRLFSMLYPSGYRTCVGCKSEIGHGRFLSCMGGFWHPQCFRCHTCQVPITDYEFSVSGNRPFHKSCYKAMHHPKCDVCENCIPTNAAGLIEYRAHPFWMQKYCPSHEFDKTPRCCSCERMEVELLLLLVTASLFYVPLTLICIIYGPILQPRNTQYLFLGDGRRLCLECLDSAIMDTHECQPLSLEIRNSMKD